MELKSAIETIPVTSADAERGFSSMNRLSACRHCRIDLALNLVFVSLTGRPVNKFNALPYVKVAGTRPSAIVLRLRINQRNCNKNQLPIDIVTCLKYLSSTLGYLSALNWEESEAE